ncbi:hypothetical protein F5H01DRAFT_338264 [Linnemannia elongata]|nr:hypothetical protein F5H01DRAFT_338264 [Linnemannia elongata]
MRDNTHGPCISPFHASPPSPSFRSLPLLLSFFASVSVINPLSFSFSLAPLIPFPLLPLSLRSVSVVFVYHRTKKSNNALPRYCRNLGSAMLCCHFHLLQCMLKPKTQHKKLQCTTQLCLLVCLLC